MMGRLGTVEGVRLGTVFSRRMGYTVWVYRYKGVLIDTGCRWTAHRLARLEAEAAFLTHWHEDHSGGAQALTRRGVPVYAGRETAQRVRRIHEARIPFYRHLTWGRPHSAPVQTAEARFAGFWLVPTPGHTPDHTALFDPEAGLIFTGDLYLGRRARFATPEFDLEALLESLDRVLELKPHRLYCAHAGLVEDPSAALRAKRDWLLKLIDAAGALGRKGWPVREISRKLLGPEPLERHVSRGELSQEALIRQAVDLALGKNRDGSSIPPA
ncbi:MBL fold metallo-hydrolase [Marinithermus hydrothermalis]|uniref:Beta-lactamase domain protein n=1 Tax=Marinithermus hydrothermalis (strain DSM 14884 / JCM 11576 / T1) TaxID=869210 RepID=F2NMJ2_MARHT|nr:MBL fold metallo-hydrolase [Marinithermus hydrothermalis]AEB12162.1 beta-lactamase domain protein [Marinithermus hydrothermalis DSM 14884]